MYIMKRTHAEYIEIFGAPDGKKTYCCSRARQGRWFLYDFIISVNLSNPCSALTFPYQMYVSPTLIISPESIHQSVFTHSFILAQLLRRKLFEMSKFPTFIFFNPHMVRTYGKLLGALWHIRNKEIKLIMVFKTLLCACNLSLCIRCT